jgi:hypothetical protein
VNVIELCTMQRDTDLEATLVAKFAVIAPVLDKHGRRLWAAAGFTPPSARFPSDLGLR